MMTRKEKKNEDFFEMTERIMSPEALERAHKMGQELILQYRLKQLREKQGIKQEDIKDFSQPSISRIESRKDIKISTLKDYLNAIGMNLEIIARSKANPKKKFVLYKLSQK